MSLSVNIETTLSEERERLEIERRDIIVQKAMIAFGQSQMNKV